MTSVQIIVRLFLLYIASVIGAVALGICVFVFCLFTTIFYSATTTTVMCFLAMPVGSTLGMYLLDKWVYRPPTYFIWRMLTAVLMSVAGFILIVLSVTQNQKDILLSPLPSELYLHLLIIGFLSLAGYILVGLIKNRGLKSEVSQYGNDITKDNGEIPASRSKKIVKFIGVIFLLGFLAMLAALALFLVTPPAAEIEAAAVGNFFQQFLASIIDDTDYYKKYSSESAIENIKNNRHLFSNNYDRYRKISQRGWYKYAIIFSEKNRFEVVIEGTNRNFFVSSFEYTGITKKRSFSDPKPLKTGKATKFFRRIIASINNETDFYKERSDESAIEQIQANRSMINSNSILAYRHIEGEWEDFYFYVVFDEKHVFEVHVGSEKGFLVKSFEYIGKNDGKWKIRGLDNVSH